MSTSAQATLQTAPPSALPGTEPYRAFGQLIRMLLPRCGSILLYDASGGLLWGSEDCERMDLRELRDRFATGGASTSRGAICTAGSLTRAYVAPIVDAEGRALGTLVVEVPSDPHSEAQQAMVGSLLRPIVECLAQRLDLERTRLEWAAADDLDFIDRIGESGLAHGDRLEQILRATIAHFGAATGAIAVPEKGLLLAVVAGEEDARTVADVPRAQKHLLAFAQLQRQPLVANGGELGMEKVLAVPLAAGEGGRAAGVLAVFRPESAADFQQRDLRQLEHAAREIMAVLDARYDALTMLLSRRAFEERAERWLDRRDPATHCLLYVDLDGLQRINDAFGYAAGDEVLQRAAALIMNEIAEPGFVSRLGGDRFAAFLPQQRAGKVAVHGERIREALAGLSYLHEGRALSISATLGLTECFGPEPLGHALARAQLACKQAKAQGGNSFAVAEQNNSDTREQRRALAYTQLEAALREGRLQLHAQPIHTLYAAGDHFGWELLLRLQEADGQVHGPHKFLRAAERYGLMPALDRWVVGNAVRLAASHPELVGGGQRLAFNVSGQSIDSEDFVDFLFAQITAAGLGPRAFCVELSMSAAAPRLAAAERFCARLTAQGLAVALDGFGSGLSSIAQLRGLPAAFLKIDGGLVRQLAHDRLAEAQVLAAVQAARALELRTIASHVETDELRLRLASYGVDYCQGYIVGPPTPVLAVLAGMEQEARGAARLA